MVVACVKPLPDYDEIRKVKISRHFVSLCVQIQLRRE